MSRLFPKGDHQAAKETLSLVLSYVTNTSRMHRLSVLSFRDKFQCFLQMAEALKGLNEERELESLLHVADGIFSGEESFHFLAFKSGLLLESGNVMKALESYDIISPVSKRSSFQTIT